MPDIDQLVRRMQQLQDHVEIVRAELANLRTDLDQLRGVNGSKTTDCLVLAQSLAEDLGPAFSSENPRELAGRGDGWFQS